VGESPLFCWAPVLNRDEIISRVTEITNRVGRQQGIETVEVEFAGSGRNRVLRIYIDKPEGVTLGDCEFISQQVGTILDVEDLIPGGSYHLEVSSPGVERKLSKPADFERFIGQRITVVLRQPIDSRKRLVGRLAGFDDPIIHLETDSGSLLDIPLDQVARANLKFDW
jgi:ribosome maturation factor RimP